MVEDAILIYTSPNSRDKVALRRELRARRVAVPAPERIRAAESVADLLQTYSEFHKPGYVAGYWAIDGELPLHVVQLQLRADQVWCLPCIQNDETLRFSPWRPGDALVSNRFDIPEPDVSATSTLAAEEMSVILLPLLGFTRSGLRLGMGGGFYDRSLAFGQKRSPRPWLLGVGYAFQEVETLPGDSWDVPLDALVTEQELIVCSRAPTMST